MMEPIEETRKPDKSKEYFFNNDVYEWHKGVWRGSGDGNLTAEMMENYVGNGTAWEWTPIPGEPPLGPSSESLGIAARCWCAPSTEYLENKIKLKQLEIEHASLAIEREQRAKVYDVYFFRKSLVELLHAWGMNMLGVIQGTAMPLSAVRGIAIWAMGAWADCLGLDINEELDRISAILPKPPIGDKDEI